MGNKTGFSRYRGRSGVAWLASRRAVLEEAAACYDFLVRRLPEVLGDGTPSVMPSGRDNLPPLTAPALLTGSSPYLVGWRASRASPRMRPAIPISSIVPRKIR
jgi:hypothetical protein